jgi:hypothetical protein
MVVGYGGEVWADADTHVVLRLIIRADAPEIFPLQSVSHVLDYGLVLIGGEEFFQYSARCGRLCRSARKLSQSFRKEPRFFRAAMRSMRRLPDG